MSRVSEGEPREVGVTLSKVEGSIYLLKFGQYSDQEFVESVHEIEALVESGHIFGMVVDVRGARAPTPAQRRMYTELLKANDSRLAVQCTSWGTIVGSKIERGILTAVSWVLRTSFPFREFDSEQDAWAWTRENVDRLARPPARVS